MQIKPEIVVNYNYFKIQFFFSSKNNLLVLPVSKPQNFSGKIFQVTFLTVFPRQLNQELLILSIPQVLRVGRSKKSSETK